MSSNIGQTALIDVRQKLSSNVLALGSVKLRISQPEVAGTATVTCTGGLPAIMLRRMTFPETPAAR